MSAMEDSDRLWGVQATPDAPAVPAMAEWWRRFAALVIDAAIVWIPLGFLSRWMDLGRYTGFAVSVAIGVTYFTLLNGSGKGQTVGKMVWGIQVRDAATGGPLGHPKAALRYLGPTLLFMIPMLGFVLWVADGFSPLWDRRRQAVHDKLAGSMVVNAAR